MVFQVVAAFLLAAQVSGELSFTKFDYHDYDRGELSTATVAFRRGETEIDLVSVVHIADLAYYQEIQRDLDSHDLVFYELVSDSSPEAMSTLSALQLAAGSLLELSFQIAEINYRAPHFVHADLSWPEITRMLGGDPLRSVPGEEVLRRVLPNLNREKKHAEDYFAGNPAIRQSLKVFLGQLLGDVPGFLKQLNLEDNGEGEDILVSARNRRAMEVLAPHLEAGKRLALFWGAAHMPDFARRLSRLGFRPVEVRWHLAWRIGEVANRRWF